MRIEKPSRAVLVAVLMVAMVVAVPGCVRVIRDGLACWNTQMVLGLPQEDLQDDGFIASLPEFSKGAWMILDGGVRWQIAQALFERTKALCYRGQFSEALDLCMSASSILGGYDSEGAFSYECFRIDERINHPERFSSSPSQPWLSAGRGHPQY